ncbi:hypothetical protein C8Q80DRAFT_1116897 [Daedaleopsis nitida]|nr:hypothetical protein C8Q80DRAFT_1116897 [Daedaleopsis nitida]
MLAFSSSLVKLRKASIDLKHIRKCYLDDTIRTLSLQNLVAPNAPFRIPVDDFFIRDLVAASRIEEFSIVPQLATTNPADDLCTRVLPFLPNLRLLSLAVSVGDELRSEGWEFASTIDALQAQPDRPIVCPRLESLYVCLLHATYLNTHIMRIKRVLKTRVERDSSYRLRRLALGFDASCTDKLRKRFGDGTVADEVLWVGKPRTMEDESAKTGEGLEWLRNAPESFRPPDTVDDCHMIRLERLGAEECVLGLEFADGPRYRIEN